MDKKQICSKFAREICTILQIEMPAIRFVSIDRLRTDTQIAALTPDGVLIRNDMCHKSSSSSPMTFSPLMRE